MTSCSLTYTVTVWPRCMHTYTGPYAQTQEEIYILKPSENKVFASFTGMVLKVKFLPIISFSSETYALCDANVP